MQRSILVSVIMLVLISLSGRHVGTFRLSRTGIEKSTLIKDTAKELFILISLFQETKVLVSASFIGREYL